MPLQREARSESESSNDERGRASQSVVAFTTALLSVVPFLFAVLPTILATRSIGLGHIPVPVDATFVLQLVLNHLPSKFGPWVQYQTLHLSPPEDWCDAPHAVKDWQLASNSFFPIWTARTFLYISYGLCGYAFLLPIITPRNRKLCLALYRLDMRVFQIVALAVGGVVTITDIILMGLAFIGAQAFYGLLYRSFPARPVDPIISYQLLGVMLGYAVVDTPYPLGVFAVLVWNLQVFKYWLAGLYLVWFDHVTEGRSMRPLYFAVEAAFHRMKYRRAEERVDGRLILLSLAIPTLIFFYGQSSSWCFFYHITIGETFAISAAILLSILLLFTSQLMRMRQTFALIGIMATPVFYSFYVGHVFNAPWFSWLVAFFLYFTFFVGVLFVLATSQRRHGRNQQRASRAAARTREEPSSVLREEQAMRFPPPIVLPEGVDLAEITDVPQWFKCPITLELMREPVITPSGITYERSALNRAIRERPVDPLSPRVPLALDSATPNYSTRSAIEAWLENEAIQRGLPVVHTPDGQGPRSRSGSIFDMRQMD